MACKATTAKPKQTVATRLRRHGLDFGIQPTSAAYASAVNKWPERSPLRSLILIDPTFAVGILIDQGGVVFQFGVQLHAPFLRRA